MDDQSPASRSLGARLTDLRLIEAALARGVREALLKHKRAGNPIAVWQDGQVRWISPEEIPVDQIRRS